MSKHELADCFYLTAMGGKENCSLRGMTLQMEGVWLTNTLNRVMNVKDLIDNQKALIERARKIYNEKTVAQEEALLVELENIQLMPVKKQRYALLDLMMGK